ncbi:putative tannase subunit protein [Lasiodiplodia theobromae]|uniref:Tannase subunit protein n=1 Tax=Lasiodiplodia theobromae TaxID=45133 RepID=UPI0015C3CC29|nr:Tannase subunit protein [Lasiodiplodia theobromae]KAF4533946.1 Tannase subunit protein [Lasiodiplodia theobromae]KAF9638234.1 putative tannase subunit protein [Lasiodiplodia theobromae]
MRSARYSIGIASAAALRATAASLADVCTTANVQSALPVDAVEGITLSTDSVTTNAVYNHSVSAGDLWPGKSGLDFCNVTFAYTRDGTSETTNVWYWLPSPDQFQGRYLTTGGGGFSITSGEQGLGNGLVYGAAAGTTDGGFGSWSAQLTDVILASNGTMDYQKLYNFGYRSIHEMTVLGKALTKNFYGSGEDQRIYSYYQGCSEGGREGWSQVQRYGSQFDGAAIGAPAFRMAFQQVAHLFSNVVEVTEDYYPPPCELEKITNDTIAACDELDGRKDGVVGRSDLCKLHYNVSASVGEPYACAASSGGGGAPGKRRKRQAPGGGSSSPAVNGTVSAAAARVAQLINDGLFDSQGRQAYVSYQPAAGFADASTTYNSDTGTWEATASGIGVQWVNYFLEKKASTSLPLTNVTYDTLIDWIMQGLQEYADTVETTWPDLSALEASGGKVIHFHGESDNSIPAASSVIYHDAVRRTMFPDLGFNESYAALHDFYRLFLVPGAAHCGVNSDQPNGPFPQNVLGSVIEWVEGGVAPEKLNATVLDGDDAAGEEQKICGFPLRPLWHGNDTMDCVYDQESIDSWLPKLDAIPVPVY